MPEPIIKAVSLTRRFGELTAVNGLTLEVSKGEIFGLVGPCLTGLFFRRIPGSPHSKRPAVRPGAEGVDLDKRPQPFGRFQ